MKKIVTFLLSVILTLNFLNLAANGYIYGENEQKTYPTTRSEGDLCEITIFMWNTGGTGWHNNTGIEITVDGVNYGGLIKLPYDFEIYEGEETILIPSGEVLFSWIGKFSTTLYGFEIYNTLGELIYTCPVSLPAGLFFTYQNECPTYAECLPITDFAGVYIPEIEQVNLTWIAPESDYLKGFDIYRNEVLIEQVSPSTVSYSDNTEELENGDYKYCVIPVYPFVCDLDEECFEAHINVGVRDYSYNILIYPNPANNVINISSDMVSAVKMYNNIGQLVLNQHNTNTINISALQNGIYILSIETSTGQTTQKKLIINH